MKFGKFLQENKARLPKAWTDQFINYKQIKKFLKSNVTPNTLSFDLTQLTWKPNPPNQPSFANKVSERLGLLQVNTTKFLEFLDAEVQKVSDFFEEQSSQLFRMYDAAVGKPEGLNQKDADESLEGIVQLENFALLNYTGVVKILKKHDRHSGLNISEAYLYRTASLPFVKMGDLSTLKKTLMDKFSGSAVTSNNTVPNLSKRKYAPSKDHSLFPSVALLPHHKVIVSLTGSHGTDVIGCVLESMAKFGVEIEDFMLSRLYHNVTFGVLIVLRSNSVELFRDLAKSAQKWDGILAFDIHDKEQTLPNSIEDAPYDNRMKYTATVLNGNGLTAQFLNEWTKLLLRENISVEKLKRLNEGKVSCADYELSVPIGVDIDNLRQDLFQLSISHGTDVALQPHDVFRKHKRLVVFDMDSTLIRQEVIDEIARIAGVVDKVASITHSAMNGEVDFKESLRRRVALLKGTPVGVLDTVRDGLQFTKGAHALCKALKKIGFKLAVISGGFMPLAQYVKQELGLDYAFANQLKVSQDGLTLTGETFGPIVDGERKAELLEVISQAENVSLDQVIAVGDGANDLWMLARAGLGIAFNAKPRVQEQARARINQHSLKYVLYLLGYTDEELKQLGCNDAIVRKNAKSSPDMAT